MSSARGHLQSVHVNKATSSSSYQLLSKSLTTLLLLSRRPQPQHKKEQEHHHITCYSWGTHGHHRMDLGNSILVCFPKKENVNWLLSYTSLCSRARYHHFWYCTHSLLPPLLTKETVILSTSFPQKWLAGIFSDQGGWFPVSLQVTQSA